jgi:site-specific recombinase XerD
MKFFYHQILGWDEKQLFIPPRKRSWQLPEVLSQKEVERLLLVPEKLRDRWLVDDGLCDGASGKRVGQAQSECH